MIVPMKKLSLVLMDRERELSLRILRSLGVVHLEKKQVNSEELTQLFETKTRIENAAGILRNYTASIASESELQGVSVGELVDTILRLANEHKEEQEALAMDLKEQKRLDRWGNFNPEDLDYLKDLGINLIPYELPRSSYVKLGEDVRLIVLSADKMLIRCVALDKTIEGETPFRLPDCSLRLLHERIKTRAEHLAQLEQVLSALTSKKDMLNDALAHLIRDIEFETAKESMEFTEDNPSDLGIAWISGFVPAKDAGLVKRAASEQGWALLIKDPSEEEQVPTLVKNNAFVSLVQPIFNLLGTVPGYREYDISLSFLLFFCLFFAMIFGDAGYGILLLVLSLGLGFSGKKKSGVFPPTALLFALLSTSTVIWGAVNGTWFALPFESLPPFLKMVVLPPFYPDPSLTAKEAASAVQQNIKHLCFIIGTGQLVLAHIKNIKKELPSLTALAQLGWLFMVVGLYFVVLNLVLDKEAFPIPPVALGMIGVGLVVYFIFVEQKGGNFAKNILKGFSNFLPTFLSAVSSFSDIISYIRLFAVGLAGFAIAESFNAMAAGIPNIIIRIIGGGLILVLGHGLNLMMNALSVVVHGVRLNMLEYSGHLGMEWSGVKYAPFALRDNHDA